MKGSTRWYDAEQLRRISEVTIAHYNRFDEAYWDGTRDHDVNQNYAALLDAIEGDPPYSILDLGCGPAETCATSDHWATTSWAWTDRRNSWPWHAPIRSARFSNRTAHRGCEVWSASASDRCRRRCATRCVLLASQTSPPRPPRSCIVERETRTFVSSGHREALPPMGCVGCRD